MGDFIKIDLGGLDVIAEYFKKSYKCKRFLERNKAPSLNFPKLYVDLAIAQRSCRQRQEQLSISVDQHIKNTDFLPSFESMCQYIPNRHVPLSYKMNNLHSTSSSEVTNNICDLFVMNNNIKPKIILVEGMPGIGKTELVKEIASRWADGGMLHEIKLMFVVLLRRPEICELYSVDDFVKYIANDVLIDEQISSLIKQLKFTGGKNVMFLPDGYDECCNKLQENCFVMRLINGQLLSCSIVFITSRPSATYHLHNQADKIAEVLGFTKEGQVTYISKAMEKFPEKSDKLRSYLRENISINSYSFIPLYLAMLVSLLNEGYLPETMTEMIGKFILYTIYYHLKSSGMQMSSKMRFQTLHDLPERALKIVCQLSNLAFNGIKNSKLVFTLKDVKQICPEIESVLDGFGLLETVEHYSQDEIGDTSYFFNFLHYSMQEYLAAFHISTLSDDEQYAIMDLYESGSVTINDPNRLQHFSTYGVNCFWHSHYSHMWLLYSGITGGKSVAFKRFAHYGTDYLDDNFTMPADKRHRLLLIQYHLEAKDDFLPKFVFNDGSLNFSAEDEFDDNVFLPHHMFALVVLLLRSPKTYTNIIFSSFEIPEDSLDILVRHFGDFRNLKSICFRANSLLSSSVEGIGDIIRMSNLEELKIIENSICKNGITEIATALAVNNRILSLTFSNIGLCDSDVSVLMNSFSADAIIESLDISDNKISNKGAQEVAMFLIRHKTLKNLDLSNTFIGYTEAGLQGISLVCRGCRINVSLLDMIDYSGIVALATALNYSSLTSLDLSYSCCLGDYGFYKLACAIQTNTTLQSLHLSGNGLNSLEGYMIANAIRMNRSVVSLNISDNEIEDYGMYTICTMLYFNTTLKQLDVSINYLNVHSAIEIGQVLQHNCVLTTLALGSNSIGDLGAKHLAAALLVNKTISSLYVRDNMIGDSGAEAIAFALKRTVTLLKLDISFNNITDNGAISIFHSLCANRTLKTLFAFFNPISFSVIEKFLSLYPDIIVDEHLVPAESIAKGSHIPLFVMQNLELERYIIITEQVYHHEWKNKMTGEVCVFSIYEYFVSENQKNCLKYYLQKKVGDKPPIRVVQLNLTV